MIKERKTYENPAELRRERKQLFSDAIRHERKPKRVPILSHAWTWKGCDAGYNLKEYFYDYEKRFDAVCQHQEKYEYDCLIELGNRNPLPVADCFGESLYKISEDLMHFNLKDYALMDEDDYPNILRDGTLKFKFERAVPFRYGVTDKQQMMDSYGKAAREYLKMVEYNVRITDQLVNKYGVPGLNRGQVGFPVDGVVSGFRGMTGLSIDMRRQPDNLEAFLKLLDHEGWPAIQKILDTYNPDEDDTFCTSLRLTSLSHTLLSKQQFGRFSWPYIKKFVDALAERHWIGILYLEGTVQHILDYLREIPEGTIGILIEQEDPVQLKKQLPNITVIGGYPSALLYTGTEQQCIDRAKKLIDEAAYDGRYIFSTDMMLSYPEDGKGENMKAVVDFVKDYGKF
jgi:hypothetical protein